MLLLCLRVSTAIPIEDDADRSPLPGNTGASRLAAEHLLSDWKEDTIDTSSRDENVANEKKTTSQQLQDQAELYAEERRHEDSCVAKHFLELCDGMWVKRYECKEASFTACHNSAYKYGTRKCDPKMTYYPQCKKTFITSCVCA